MVSLTKLGEFLATIFKNVSVKLIHFYRLYAAKASGSRSAKVRLPINIVRQIAVFATVLHYANALPIGDYRLPKMLFLPPFQGWAELSGKLVWRRTSNIACDLSEG